MAYTMRILPKVYLATVQVACDFESVLRFEDHVRTPVFGRVASDCRCSGFLRIQERGRTEMLYWLFDLKHKRNPARA